MIGHPSPTGTPRPTLDSGNGSEPVATLAEAPLEPPVVAPRARPSTGQWLTLLVGVVVVGLALGAVVAAVSGASRRGGVVPATANPAGAPGRAAGAAGAADAVSSANPSGSGPGSGGGPAAAGAARGPGRATAGTIESVDGDTVVVTTPEGSVRVNLGDTTSLQKQVPAERSDLAPGQRVLVTGERDADGAVAASSVQIGGEGGPGGRAGPRGDGAPSPRTTR
jgi:hypothetical protein